MASEMKKKILEIADKIRKYIKKIAYAYIFTIEKIRGPFSIPIPTSTTFDANVY